MTGPENGAAPRGNTWAFLTRGSVTWREASVGSITLAGLALFAGVAVGTAWVARRVVGGA